MSSGLMSCVRENSPPLELDMNATAGPLSLPEVDTSANMLSGAATSTPLSSREEREGAKAESSATTSAEQQKRRRFHPLRNLRRIFRRRTINSAADSTAASAAAAASASAGSCSTLPPPASSASEKNLRSATLSSISTGATVSATASSPSSPLSHQQLQESYQTQSLPKSKSYGTHRDELLSVLLGKKKHKANKNDKSATGTPTHEASGIQYQHQHQQQQQQQQDLDDNSEMYSATSTATSSSYHQRFQQNAAAMHAAQSRQSLGIAVFPSAMNRGFFAERQKLRSVGDSSQELDSSGNESGAGHLLHATASSSNGGEMSDSQRSLSEGRLLDSDYTRDALSQSHDSVFSESATASSLSIVLKAELADVLRKRRNRPDASDEDLGLPRSPASPQRRIATAAGNRNAGGTMHNVSNATTSSTNTTGGEASSLSLLSMNSTDGEDSVHVYNARVSMTSSLSMSSDILRPHHEQQDEVDRVSTERHRLSHSAAKHKMAIRPTKKNVPSRQHRRTLETSIPEANEDIPKLSGSQQPALKMETDLRAKTRSLPPGINAEQMATMTAAASTTKRSKAVETNSTTTTSTNTSSAVTTKKELTNAPHAFSSSSSTTTSSSSSSTSHSFGLRALTTKASALFEHRESSTDDEPQSKPVAVQVESNDSGFLRRLIQRNSKRSLAKANNDEHDSELNQSEPKKLQISTSYMEAVDRQPLLLPDKTRSATSYEQNIEETRKTIKREITNEGKNGLSAMVNSYGLTTTAASPQREREHQPQPPTAAAKPKSGPAARQRYLPQELNSSPDSTLVKHANSNSSLEHEEVISVTNLLSKSSRGNDTFQSTTILREINAMAHASNANVKAAEAAGSHFEKKGKIVGLSAFQQKLTRSNESVGRNSNSSNSLETSTDEPSPLYYAEKQRKTVEKSRSFRNYDDDRDDSNGSSSGVSGGLHSNMPSLPDLSLSFRVPVSYYNDFVGLKKDKLTTPTSPLNSPTEKCVSLGFEINDNKLLKPTAAPRAESTGRLTPEKNIIHTSTTASKKPTPAKLGAMVPNLSPRNSTNISEIEQNIDLIVKSPFVSVLRKTANSNGDELASCSSLGSPTKAPRAASPTKKESQKLHKERPKVLELKQQTTEVARQQTLTQTQTHSQSQTQTPNTPSAAVPMREKTAKAAAIVKISPTADSRAQSATGQERKSAPATTTQASTQSNAAKAQSFKSSRRSTSVVENGTSSNHVATPIASEPISSTSEQGAHVPEFMKIQLNRVDHARLSKGNNLVLAKNIKPESSPPTVTESKPTERSYSTDDLSMRHASNDSIEITEREAIAGGNKQRSSRQPRSPQPRQGNNFFEAISRQTRAVSAHSVRRTSVSSTGSASGKVAAGAVEEPNVVNPTPKSPVKSLHGVNGLATPTKSPTTTTPTTPLTKSPTIASSPVKQQQQQQQQQQQIHNTPKSPMRSIDEPPLVVLRTAETVSSAMMRQQQLQQQQSKISLEERRRLFLTEDKTKTDKKIEELRMERKKSITEELYRKSLEEPNHIANGTSTNNGNTNAAAASNAATVNAAVESVESTNPVVLRKKSFAGAQHANSFNGSNGNVSSSANNNNNNNDATPELMKVFARRSLKVKDEDILVCVAAVTAHNVAANGNGGANALKKSTAQPSQQQPPVAQLQSQSVDSDKENQSASEEKLDKLSKYEANATESVKLTHANNRISLADFRSGSGLSYVNNNHLHHHHHHHNNSNNNNNNSGNEHAAGNATTMHSNGCSSSLTTGKSYLPPIKVGNLRHSQHNNNSNNNNNNSNHLNNNNIANLVITTPGSNNNNNNTNNNNNNNTNERYSLQIKKESSLLTNSTGSATATTPPLTAAATPTKSIERSATVGEFKGIHQRRAEWEQRAKEALK